MSDGNAPLPADVPSPRPLDPRPPTTGDSMRVAVLIVVSFIAGTIVLPAMFSQLGVLIVVGPAQLVWAIPMLIYARVARRPRLFKVTLIGAGIVFLLNVTCTVIVFSTMRFGG